MMRTSMSYDIDALLMFPSVASVISERATLLSCTCVHPCRTLPIIKISALNDQTETAHFATFVYILRMIVVLFAPSTSRTRLNGQSSGQSVGTHSITLV